MKIPSHKEFTDFIKKYLEDTGQSPSGFGRKVLNDSGAIPRLFEGTDPRLSTMHKINDEISKDKK